MRVNGALGEGQNRAVTGAGGKSAACGGPAAAPAASGGGGAERTCQQKLLGTQEGPELCHLRPVPPGEWHLLGPAEQLCEFWFPPWTVKREECSLVTGDWFAGLLNQGIQRRIMPPLSDLNVHTWNTFLARCWHLGLSSSLNSLYVYHYHHHLV